MNQKTNHGTTNWSDTQVSEAIAAATVPISSINLSQFCIREKATTVANEIRSGQSWLELEIVKVILTAQPETFFLREH